MLLNRNLKFVNSTVFITSCFLMIERSLECHVYNLLDEIRLSMFFKQENLRKAQISNGVIHEDGITHIEINELNPQFSEIKRIEDEFKNIIAMNETKYKRNFYWRTWREVKDSNGNLSHVCYKCRNIVNITCSSCNCGYWEIEEKPPCPFEIFSVLNSTKICVVNYNQLKSSYTNCPSIISFTDLVHCDNPIETRWRVNRQHGATKVSERHSNVICDTRETCEFLTVYSILPDHVIFRIINSSNDIIYSRIMKNNNRNYACLNNCGVYKPFNHFTKQHRQTPLLSGLNIKNKLSDNNKIKNKSDKKNSLAKKIANATKPNDLTKILSTDILHVYKDATTAAPLQCKHLQKHSEEDDEESEYEDY